MSAAPPTPDAILQLGTGVLGLEDAPQRRRARPVHRAGDAGPLDAEALRERLGLHQRSARDFFDALVALGMLEREDGKYRNTPETDLFLDRNKPSYQGGLLEMLNARLFGFWNDLTEGLRTGEPQNEAKTGGNLFEAIYSDPACCAGSPGR